MYSEITVWSVTHNCLHFTLWVTRSLIIIKKALFLTVSNSLIVKYALYIPISGLQNTQNSITIKKLCFNCTPHAWNSFFIKLTFSSVSLSFSAAILLFWHISRHLAQSEASVCSQMSEKVRSRKWSFLLSRCRQNFAIRLIFEFICLSPNIFRRDGYYVQIQNYILCEFFLFLLIVTCNIIRNL